MRLSGGNLCKKLFLTLKCYTDGLVGTDKQQDGVFMYLDQMASVDSLSFWRPE